VKAAPILHPHITPAEAGAQFSDDRERIKGSWPERQTAKTDHSRRQSDL